MTSHELRERFLRFFEQRQHVIVPSDSLIPTGDPTVLFTSAGMNQFKDAFLGKRTDLRRAASCQTCMRTGDLERVGKTPSHHTFFEMLGNFSFGDYFKPEAIEWAWQFLTREIRLAEQRLWPTVFEDDDEAFAIWERQIKVPARRITRLGEADNFWPASARSQGPNGPCGPCSEVHFDRTGVCGRGRSDCNPGCGCGRFVEVWNLVFTQFNRQDGGKLEPLPRKNIDTGMGLERLASVVQGAESDYETDLFRPIVEAVRHLPKSAKAKSGRVAYAERAIADHIRAIVFLITDGVLPSNEGRGYVLRMLIRRAYRLGTSALGVEPVRAKQVEGFPVPEAPLFLATLVPSVRQAMRGSPYDAALASRRESTIRAIAQEEAQFVETLESGISRLEELIGKLLQRKQATIPGEEAFKLYDTYGFPIELTVDIAEERGLAVDRPGFDEALRAQQTRSRASSQFGQGIFVPTTLKLDRHEGRSEFVGYDQLKADSTVLGIWSAGQWANEAVAGEEIGVVLERSPFYGESGGQVGDQGVLETPIGTLEVVDVKWVDTLLVHHARVREGRVKVGDPVHATVDAARRRTIAASHTATHLLHWALRTVLGPETVQAGSLVEPERVRFDFSSLGGLRDEQQIRVEQLVNERVRAGDEVRTTLMDLQQAKQAGALALFGEKYDQQVRVVTIADYSRELCGGTHLLHTGFVGTFRIVAESAIAASTRRIEALVGEAAVARQQHESHTLKQIAQRLSRPPHEALEGLEELLGKMAGSERKIKALTADLAQVQAKQLVASAKRINGASLVSAHLQGVDRELLAALADSIKGSLATGVVLLVASQPPATVAWVMATTPDLIKRGVHAGQMLKAISSITQGGGGGRPEFAQAGGKDPSKITEALARGETLVREALER